jgi:hypothetical protein
MLSWVVVSVMGVAVLTLAGAFAPPVARRLVLFHLVYGIVGGFGMSWLAREWGLAGTVPAGTAQAGTAPAGTDQPENAPSEIESDENEEIALSRISGGGWLLPLLGGLILIAGGINMGWVSYRQFEQARRELAGEKSEQLAILSMLEQMSDVDEELARRYEEERRQFAPTFPDYLVHRVSALGKWAPHWAWLFWGSELALAGVSGGWMIRYRLKPARPH